MYNGFYKLKENPFRLTPDPAYVYMTSQHREAFSGLIFSVCERPGLTVLVGEVGTGKTTLLYTLLSWLEKRKFITAVCTNPILTREELYDLLLVQLRVECPSPLKNRQLTALKEALLQYRKNGLQAILVVDEAQRLSTDLLEEIRLLLNIETPQEKLLEIILAGQPELADTLQRPELRQLKQRVSAFCKLEPLSLEELREYVWHRLGQAGLAQAGLPQQSLFADDAVRVIHEYTHGIPRLVNSLCDSALQTGFALQAPQITIAIVREAAKDLDLVQEEPRRVSPSNGDGRVVASPPLAPAGPVSSSQPANGRENRQATERRMPLEDYATRQRSLGFLAQLMDRWR